MLLYKTLHKGNFVKEIFKGTFYIDTETNYDTQILQVSEKRIELYNYLFDKNLNIPFLEPIITQDMFFHILDAKTINHAGITLLALLTNCGLVVMKCSPENKCFMPVCSESININYEQRDKLINIRTHDE
jgi:hypothetical protein